MWPVVHTLYTAEALTEKSHHEWDEFNNGSRNGTVYHSIRWKKFLEDAFGLECRYYIVRESGEAVGICPFVEEYSGPFRGLIPLPHSEFNNVILDDSVDPCRFNEILDLYAKEYSYLQFTTYDRRLVDRITYDTYPDDRDGNMIIDLSRNPPDAIWESRAFRDVRKKIRRFEKDGFEVKEIRSEGEIEEYYHYYVENMHHIGGKILPLSFYTVLLNSSLSRDVRVVSLTRGDLFAGGMLTILHPDKKTACFEYLSLNRNVPAHFTPTYLLFWEGITWAHLHGIEKISLGCQHFDVNNPRFRAKMKFGAEHVPFYSRLVLLSKPVSLLYAARENARHLGRQAAAFFW